MWQAKKAKDQLYYLLFAFTINLLFIYFIDVQFESCLKKNTSVGTQVCSEEEDTDRWALFLFFFFLLFFVCLIQIFLVHYISSFNASGFYTWRVEITLPEFLSHSEYTSKFYTKILVVLSLFMATSSLMQQEKWLFSI